MFPSTDIVHHFHPIAWVKQMKLVFGDNGICVCEARVRAFMRMIRVGEGTGELVKSYDKKKKKIVYIEKDFEEGYTTAFGGHKITDLSKHPEKNYGGSTAAGAYQVMRYTWWWLKGEKLTKSNKKSGIYEKWHDYIKKYNIADFKPESQDKLCVAILKHKRKGILKLISENKIEKAIRNYASKEWASLPHTGDYSKYKFKGKLQPATPMKDCLSHYNEFLTEELKGESNLYLKKGFLKGFGIDCCNNENGEKQINKDGVLEEMKMLVDKHIPYSQLGERASLSKDGLEALDCSETVGIYLHKLGVMPNLTAIHTGLMTTQIDFRKAIGTQNIDLVPGSNKSNFKPQRGDIFVWRSGVGHTGIVYDFDESTDLITILEAIGSSGARGESQQVANGGDSVKGCTRTAIYKRLSSALFKHPGWIGYFRPKNYTKKL